MALGAPALEDPATRGTALVSLLAVSFKLSAFSSGFG